MKKTSFLSLLIISSVAAFVMSSCQKDTTTLRLRFDSFGRNSKVWIDGSTPKWNTGDPVWINENRVEVASAASTTITVASAPSYRAVYPFDIVTSYSGNTFNLSIPQEQLYSEVNGKQVVKAPMVAYTTGSTLTFRNLGALLAITVQNNTDNASYAIKEIRVKSKDETLPLWGTATVNNITDTGASLQCAAVSGNNVDPYTVYLRKYGNNNQQVAIYTFNANSGNASYKTFYVYVPVHGNVNNRFRIEVVPMSGVPKWREQSSASGGNLERNQMVSVPFELERVVAPTGAVPEGKFSINPAGDQVFFAAGNLQYQPSTGIWRIAPHQEDVVGGDYATSGSFPIHNVSGSSNSSVSSSYSGWIDLFGWATSGYDNRSSDPYATRFHPYDYEKEKVKTDNTSTHPIGNNTYGYGPSTQKGSSLDGDNANYDWGVYCGSVLQYGTGTVTSGSTWRTLTSAEWNYLLVTRVVNGGTGEHHSWSVVTYNGVQGILIYPDGYTAQVTPTETDQRHKVIPSIPEMCVFLPEAGRRSVTTSNNVSSPCMEDRNEGCYWTVSGNTTSKASYAYSFNFNVDEEEDPSIAPATQIYRYLGCAVRLVTPVP